MKRQRKKYSRPQKPFDKVRIDDENVLRERYGLKNKKEIWRADAAVGRIRNQAKKLITSSDEEKNAFIEKLQKKGFEIENIADVLALNKENWLKRRLQTIVHVKKFVSTPKQARQLITHKHVSIDGQVVNVPSYQVSMGEESQVKLDITLKVVEKPKSKEEQIKEDILEGKEDESEVVEENIETEVNEKNEEKQVVEENNELIKEPKIEEVKVEAVN